MDEDWKRIEAFLTGDNASFEFIFQKYKSRVLNLAFGFLRERTAAEDAAQEVFLKIYQKRLKPDPKAKFFTWLYRVTVNAAFDVLRRRKFAPDSLDRKAGPESESRIGDLVPDTQASSPGQRLENEDTASCIRRHIDKLPEKLRSPLLLYQFEELSYREIARILKISEKAVERRLYHAREILQRSLAPFLF